MEKRGQFTWEEIQSQPEAWRAALEVLSDQRTAIQKLWQAGSYDQVIFTGCGSTYYLSLAASALFQELSGRTGRAFPASELWFYPKSSYPGTGRVLLVAVSRSGETTETLQACRAFLESRRGDLLTLSCYPEHELAGMGKLNLVFPSGAERSVAQTRAFSTLFLATTALAALWSGRQELLDQLGRLPDAGRSVLEGSAELVGELGRDQSLDRFYFLGSGPRYGLACELSLKMKEMSLSHSEPFHFPEFRHGPKSMVTSCTLVVGLLSQGNREREQAVLEDMRSLGGRVLPIGEAVGEEAGEVAFRSGLEQALQNILFLPVGQILGYERSISKRLDPDQPHNLDAVVRL